MSTRYYEDAGTDGNYYYYGFGPIQLSAGGRGKIISPVGRGRMWTDFSGYDPNNLQEVCQSYSAAYCREVRPGVLVMAQKADSTTLCHDTYMGAPGFLAFVAVNLPHHEKITGVAFPMSLYPEAVQIELNRLLDMSNAQLDCNDPEKRAAFDQRIDELFAALEQRTTIPAEGAWWEALLRFADSIAIDP